MVRSYPQTWFITKDNVRRTNTRGKRLWKTKNNVRGLVMKTEEDNINYDELKMLAQDRSRWCQWRWKPAYMGRILPQQQFTTCDWLERLVVETTFSVLSVKLNSTRSLDTDSLISFDQSINQSNSFYFRVVNWLKAGLGQDYTRGNWKRITKT